MRASMCISMLWKQGMDRVWDRTAPLKGLRG
jgi:hypothetical protein